MHSEWPEESWERLGSQLLFEVADFKRRFENNRASFIDFITWSIENGRAGIQRP